MSPVRVIHASYVNVPATAALPLESIKLTAMEAMWVTIPVLQHVLLYEGADMPPFEDILQALRSSLAVTLGSFAPLAGKLVHLKDTGDVAISCSASDSVKFVVAESDTDVRRLALDEEHDLPVLEQLVPDVDMSKLPTAVLAVQATRFDGGVAVGVTVHHAVADGRSLWTFVEAWATACRGETPALTPTFERSLVKLPGGQEEARRIFQRWAPNLPLVAPPPSFLEDRPRFTRRTFTLDMPHIQRLKQHIVRLGEAHDAPLTHPPSTFVTVTALAWTCFARCKQFPLDDDVPLLFFADVRDRLDPPVDRGYIGVCLTRCLAMLPARELRRPRALLTAAAALQDEIRRMNRDPADQQSHLTPIMLASWDRLMNVSGSSAFAAYDIADFGWGKPRRTEPIRMNHDGQVALMRGRDGLGVQVSVSLLQQAQMDEFKSLFLELLHSN
ncbi:hypothetical protein QYE76_018744 [Lolium multiflorum]|uniref:Uncharacterized protein n=1 Tax=Lolium multiflorum TaxID=4521 RepID=A0AAD8Q8Y9_LOLMU|nr:hypothetical protein QYE76_018744 [Lolium multiflorum]